MSNRFFVNTYAGNPLDRASTRRADAAWLKAQHEDASSKTLAMWKGAPLTAGGEHGLRLAWLPMDLLTSLQPDAEPLFLGLNGERAVFAVEVEGSANPSEGPLHGLGRFTGLREATPHLPNDEAAQAATARAVFEWGRRHRFCAACGQPTRVADGGWRRQCAACGAEHFPRTDPVVIMLPLFAGRCLLGRQATWDPGRYSALAGFMEPGESIEEACAREVMEEAGLTVVAVRYHSSQPWPFPSNLMIGLFAEVTDENATPDQTELEAARWFTRQEAADLLAGRLPGFSAPPPLAIAHSLLRAWVDGAADEPLAGCASA